jgi:hypothetical protein
MLLKSNRINPKTQAETEAQVEGANSPCLNVVIEERRKTTAALSKLNSRIVCIEVGTLLNKYQQRF